MQIIEEDTCKFCQIPTTKEHPLIHPCKCTGTIKYIHEDCLLTWLKEKKSIECELCHHRYLFNSIYKKSITLYEVLRIAGECIFIIFHTVLKWLFLGLHGYIYYEGISLPMLWTFDMEQSVTNKIICVFFSFLYLYTVSYLIYYIKRVQRRSRSRTRFALNRAVESVMSVTRERISSAANTMSHTHNLRESVDDSNSLTAMTEDGTYTGNNTEIRLDGGSMNFRNIISVQIDNQNDSLNNSHLVSTHINNEVIVDQDVMNASYQNIDQQKENTINKDDKSENTQKEYNNQNNEEDEQNKVIQRKVTFSSNMMYKNSTRDEYNNYENQAIAGEEIQRGNINRNNQTSLPVNNNSHSNPADDLNEHQQLFLERLNQALTTESERLPNYISDLEIEMERPLPSTSGRGYSLSMFYYLFWRTGVNTTQIPNRDLFTKSTFKRFRRFLGTILAAQGLLLITLYLPLILGEFIYDLISYDTELGLFIQEMDLSKYHRGIISMAIVYSFYIAILRLFIARMKRKHRNVYHIRKFYTVLYTLLVLFIIFIGLFYYTGIIFTYLIVKEINIVNFKENSVEHKFVFIERFLRFILSLFLPVTKGDMENNDYLSPFFRLQGINIERKNFVYFIMHPRALKSLYSIPSTLPNLIVLLFTAIISFVVIGIFYFLMSIPEKIFRPGLFAVLSSNNAMNNSLLEDITVYNAKTLIMMVLSVMLYFTVFSYSLVFILRFALTNSNVIFNIDSIRKFSLVLTLIFAFIIKQTWIESIFENIIYYVSYLYCKITDLDNYCFGKPRISPDKKNVYWCPNQNIRYCTLEKKLLNTNKFTENDFNRYYGRSRTGSRFGLFYKPRFMILRMNGLIFVNIVFISLFFIVAFLSGKYLGGLIINSYETIDARISYISKREITIDKNDMKNTYNIESTDVKKYNQEISLEADNNSTSPQKEIEDDDPYTNNDSFLNKEEDKHKNTDENKDYNTKQSHKDNKNTEQTYNENNDFNVKQCNNENKDENNIEDFNNVSVDEEKVNFNINKIDYDRNEDKSKDRSTLDPNLIEVKIDYLTNQTIDKKIKFHSDLAFLLGIYLFFEFLHCIKIVVCLILKRNVGRHIEDLKRYFFNVMHFVLSQFIWPMIMGLHIRVVFEKMFYNEDDAEIVSFKSSLIYGFILTHTAFTIIKCMRLIPFRESNSVNSDFRHSISFTKTMLYLVILPIIVDSLIKDYLSSRIRRRLYCILGISPVLVPCMIFLGIFICRCVSKLIRNIFDHFFLLERRVINLDENNEKIS